MVGRSRRDAQDDSFEKRSPTSAPHPFIQIGQRIQVERGRKGGGQLPGGVDEKRSEPRNTLASAA